MFSIKRHNSIRLLVDTNIEYQNAFQNPNINNKAKKKKIEQKKHNHMCLIMHDAFGVLRRIGPEIKPNERKKMIQFWNPVCTQRRKKRTTKVRPKE